MTGRERPELTTDMAEVAIAMPFRKVRIPCEIA